MRATSTNTAVLRTLAELAPRHVSCQLYEELGDLPAFNPDADLPPLAPPVHRLRAAVHRAHGIVFSTPEYAGALPGSFKNLLDWTIGDDDADSIYEKPVGWINASARAAEGAYGELQTVLGYAHAQVVEAACIDVPITTTMIGEDSLVADHEARAALARLVEALGAADARAEERKR